MQIITAPSKTQAFQTGVCEKFSHPLFLDKSLTIIDCLKELTRTELSRLLKTSDTLTQSTLDKIENFSLPFHPNNACPSLFTFQGDVYSALTPENYSCKELDHAQTHLRILSGLYGILRPLDLMQPYRLEMATKLKVGAAEDLYSYWRDDVTQALNNWLAHVEEKIVLNLASKEYAKVVDRRKLEGRIVEVVFQQPHKGGLRTIPIHAKRARGEMIHFILENRVIRAEDVKLFNRDDYVFAPDSSTESSWLFVQQKD